MTITLKVSENTKLEMEQFFEDYKRKKTPPYAVFQADDADCVVTLYESGKAVFQGISADISAQIWIEREKHLNPNKKIDVTNSDHKKKEQDKKQDKNDWDQEKVKVYNHNCIGSDEVGTGDYFGPIVVTSAYVNKDNIAFLESLGVKDSKKLSDDKIEEIVPQIIKKIPYKTLILTNLEYNERYNDDMNMNKIKAIMHNKVLYQLKQEISDYEYIVVDQFCNPYIYYNYLNSSNTVVKNITFITKAEDKCLAVACASLISRYIFLHEFDKLGEKIDNFLIKGASDKVDIKGLEIVRKYGFSKLGEIAKLNFKNTSRIKELYEKETN